RLDDLVHGRRDRAFVARLCPAGRVHDRLWVAAALPHLPEDLPRGGGADFLGGNEPHEHRQLFRRDTRALRVATVPLQRGGELAGDPVRDSFRAGGFDADRRFEIVGELAIGDEIARGVFRKPELLNEPRATLGRHFGERGAELGNPFGLRPRRAETGPGELPVASTPSFLRRWLGPAALGAPPPVPFARPRRHLAPPFPFLP